MMNDCCQIKGNARIQHSTNPQILLRVVCQYCALVIHEERKGPPHPKKEE